MNQKSAIHKINQQGVLLVFPIDNKKEPKSLWSEFYPRSKMRWEWNTEGDSRVSDMWMLMKQLSDTKKVVYTKWYQGRATFFSREVFSTLLCVFQNNMDVGAGLSRTARQLLETLQGDSPLSTKQLKALTELQGKDNESLYNRSMKELFSRFLIVAFGEVDDGAFPSLAVGATSLLYEELLSEAQSMDVKRAWAVVDRFLPERSLFRKHLDKVLKSVPRHEAFLS